MTAIYQTPSPPRMKLVTHGEHGEETFGELHKQNIKWLTMHTWMMRSLSRTPGARKLPYRYSSIEEMLLFNATSTSAVIEETPLPEMTPGNCFQNAFTISLGNRRFRYAEGWATMEQSLPTHHGWLIDDEGNIHDPTWKAILRNYRRRGDIPPERTIRASYFGISIPLADHIAWFQEQGTMNLLYSGEMAPPAVLEKGMAAYSYPGSKVAQGDVDEILATLADVPQWALSDDKTHWVRGDEVWHI